MKIMNCKIIQRDENGNVINIFNSTTEALVGIGKNANTDKSSINESIRKGRKAYGFYWERFIPSNNVSSEVSKHSYHRPTKKVCMIDRDTKKVVKEFGSVKEAAQSLGVPDNGSIYGAISKKHTFKNYLWEYVDSLNDITENTPNATTNTETDDNTIKVGNFVVFKDNEVFKSFTTECEAKTSANCYKEACPNNKWLVAYSV